MPDTGTNELDPTVFVLFGATGDLARRMVLPAFFQLAQHGLLPDAGGSSAAAAASARRGVRRHVHDALRSSAPPPTTDRGTTSRSGCASPAAASPPTTRAACSTPSRTARASWGTTRSSCTTSPCRPRRSPTTPGRWAPTVWARAPASSTRSRSGPRPRASASWTTWSTPSSPRSRSSGSTTSSARRAPRTCTRCGSPTACSSRCGAASTWPRCRSTSPRPRRRRPGRLLRRHRRDAGHAGHPPVPGRGRGRHGAAGQLLGQRHPSPRGVGAGEVPPARAGGRRAGPVRGLPARLDGVPDDRTTDTFVAARLFIDSGRWRGVPFLLRTGKRLAAKQQRVSLILHRPKGPVDDVPANGNVVSPVARRGRRGRHRRHGQEAGPGPGDGPGPGVPGPVEDPGGEPLAPYVSLIHDVLVGDRSLFTDQRGARPDLAGAAAGARPPARGAPVRPGLVGAGGGQRADRRARLAAGPDGGLSAERPPSGMDGGRSASGSGPDAGRLAAVCTSAAPAPDRGRGGVPRRQLSSGARGHRSPGPDATDHTRAPGSDTRSSSS